MPEELVLNDDAIQNVTNEETNKENIQKQAAENDEIITLSNRINSLIEKTEHIKISEEPSKIKELNTKIDILEKQIAKMVEMGVYNPDKSLNNSENVINKSPVNDPNLTTNSDVMIFNSLRDMDFNITDNDINK